MDLTSTEKGSGVGVVILSTLLVGGMFLGMSFLGHTHAPPPAPPKPVRGVHTPPPKAPDPGLVNRPLTSPLSWISIIPTLGMSRLHPLIAMAIGLGLGFLYGLEAALLASYDLTDPAHWCVLLVDLTWSLPSTLLGFVLVNPIYMIIGSFSRDQSRGKAWISFSGSLGKSLQTIGTVNLGGAGAHERVHLLQARILGPAFVPLQLTSYVLNTTIQILFTVLIGWILKVAGVRDSAWFRPPSDSVVKSPAGDSGFSDFVGWIYRYTLMEIWGYAAQ